MLKPVLTEKSMNEAKKGNYTFFVGLHLDKFGIKKEIEDTFGVHVVRVRTIKIGGERKKNIQGRKRVIKPIKKAVVALREKEKIDLFDTKSKK